MIERHFDAAAINYVLNDPYVRPDVALPDDGVLDMTSAVADHKNVLLMGEHGGCMFFYMQHGIYEVHTQVLKSGRGPWVAKFVKQCADWMFTRTSAYEITTRVPFEHAAARALAVHAGMMYDFLRPEGCVWRGELQAVEVYSFRLQDWAKHCETFDEAGAQFHDFLHGEAVKLGIKDPPHADDPNHNRYVGQAIEMAKHGQAVKAAAWYNRWTAVARHRPIALLQAEYPVLIKFDIGVLHIEADGRMSVLPLC